MISRRELYNIRSLIDHIIDVYIPDTNDVNIKHLTQYAEEMCTLLERLYDYLGIKE